MYNDEFQSTSNKRNQGFIENKLLRFLFFFCIPFLLINGTIFFLATTKPSYEIDIGDTNDYITTSFTLKVTSLFPYKDLSVSLDGDTIELIPSETEKKTYSASVNKNGNLEISIKNFNGMPAASFEQINTLDDNPPTVSDQVIEDGILTIHLTDTQSGIDYSSIYSVNSFGSLGEPLTVDKETGFLTFNMDVNGLTIHVQDLAGNEKIVTCNVSTDNDDAVSDELIEEEDL